VSETRCIGVLQAVDEHLLGLAVGAVASVVTGEPARVSQRLPVGGTVTGTGEAAGIDEGLGQQQGVAVHALPIRGETAQIQRQHPRGQIGNLHAGQDQEPRIVGQQVQALVMQHPRPTDPVIACGALQCCRLPAEQGQPTAIGHGDITQRLAEQRTQAEVVMPIDQRIPARALLGLDRAHAHLTQQIRIGERQVGQVAGHGCPL
jgi:hypothetical protein